MSTGAGRSPALLNIPDVEETCISRNRPVALRMADKWVVITDLIVEIPEELLAEGQFLEAFDGSRKRVFSPANPDRDIQLPDGWRLAAACNVTAFPVVSMHRHPFREQHTGRKELMSTESWLFPETVPHGRIILCSSAGTTAAMQRIEDRRVRLTDAIADTPREN